MKEKILNWMSWIPVRIIFFAVRLVFKFTMRFYSQERLYLTKIFLDEYWNNHGLTKESIISDFKKAASEENLYWLWITAEAIEDFYKKSSWIETV